jgi:hypothetical protein
LVSTKGRDGVQSRRWIPVGFASAWSEQVKTKVGLAVLVLCCSLALSTRVQSQEAGIAETIKQLQQDKMNAQMKNDVSWAEQHLADGFIAGHSWGKWENKADFIKNFQSKTNQWTSGNISDVHVATFGSTTAVTHYTFTYDAKFNGTHRARPVICSDTWVNESGTWKLAATHCSASEGK